MSPLTGAGVLPFRCETVGAGGRAVLVALRSGQGTPRSGIGSSGALGSSSAGSGGGGETVGGAFWACNGPGSNAEAAAAHHQCARMTLNPHPLIQGEALTSAPEPRQYVPPPMEGLSERYPGLRRC